jgi:hypothetical protein
MSHIIATCAWKIGKKITFCEMREREKNCLLAYENVVVHIHSDETGKLFKEKKNLKLYGIYCFSNCF